MSKYSEIINREYDDSQHVWDKKNPITIVDKSGAYDIYKCKKCGIESKSKTIGFLKFETNSLVKIQNFRNCPKYVETLSLDDEPWDAGNTVILNNITFTNKIEGKFLIKNSEHKIINPPEEYKQKYPNSEKTIWVMGVTEPVRLLVGEYIFKNKI